MEQLVSQRRVRFGGQGLGETDDYTGRTAAEQIESLTGYQEQSWFELSFPRYVSQEYDPQEMEFAVAVAAAASAIDAVEEAEAERKRRAWEEVERSRINARREEMKTGRPMTGRVTRRYPSREVVIAGETATRNSIGQELKDKERPRSNGAGKRKQKGGSSRLGSVETWERSQMEKIRQRYEKIKSSIIAWENERKTLARKKQERIQADFEERKTRNQRHYQAKIARIEQISSEARLQAEQKRRREEQKVEGKAKKMRDSGKFPVKYCFCF